MFSGLLLHHARTGADTGAGRFVEQLEDRHMLSAAVPSAISAAVQGSTFTGQIAVSVPVAPAHAATSGVTLVFNSSGDGNLSGTETIAGQPALTFTASGQGQSFTGVFADNAGTIAGTFSADNLQVTGSVNQGLMGQRVTEQFSATNQTALPLSTVQKQPILNFYAGAGTVTNAISPATAGNTITPAVPVATSPNPVGTTLPVLDAATPGTDVLNFNLPPNGVNNFDLTNNTNQALGFLSSNANFGLQFSNLNSVNSNFTAGSLFQNSAGGLTSIMNGSNTFGELVSIFSGL